MGASLAQTDVPRSKLPDDLADPSRGPSRAAPRRRRFGKYRVLARLGEDGATDVHLALLRGPVGFNKLLVVESVRGGFVDPHALRAFLNEARLAAQLHHANVVQTYEVGEEDGELFVAMEYVEGRSLRAICDRVAPGRLPLAVHLRVVHDVARGVHHAHQLKSFDGRALDVVHGGICPERVLVGYEGQVKLAGFGLARADARGAWASGPRLAYVAPEQLASAHVDARADVFALGVLVFEAIAGTPFVGERALGDAEIRARRIAGAEPRLSEVVPAAPPRLLALCDRALEVDPSKRMPSAAEVASELADYLAETSRGSDARRLADLVAPLFERERAHVRAVVEAQASRLAAAEEGPDGPELDEIPYFHPPRANEASEPPPEVLVSNIRAKLPTRSPTPTESVASPRVALLAALCVALLVGIVGALVAAKAARDAERDDPLFSPAGAPER